MSSMMLATQIWCDWPECRASTQTEPPEAPTQKQGVPAGWVCLPDGIRDPFGRHLQDFCPEHAARPVEELAALQQEGGMAT